MTTPKILEINAETGVQELRNFNAEELAQHQKDVAEFEANKAAELVALEAKKEAATKLIALGLDPKLFGLNTEIGNE